MLRLRTVFLLLAILFSQAIFAAHTGAHALIAQDHCELAKYAPTQSCLVPDVSIVPLLHVAPHLFISVDDFFVCPSVPAYFPIRAPPAFV